MLLITNSTLRQETSIELFQYFNSTNTIHPICLWNGRSYSLEKIIFPQQRILFEAKPEEILEGNTKQEGEQLLESIFACHNIKVKQH